MVLLRLWFNMSSIHSYVGVILSERTQALLQEMVLYTYGISYKLIF